MSASAFLALALCLGQTDHEPSCVENDSTAKVRAIGERIESFILADDTMSYDAISTSSELFGPASVDELELLRLDSNDRVAVRSAWELTCRQVTTESNGLTEDTPMHLGAFLGFVEGRLRVRIPQELKDALLTVEVSVAEYGYDSTFSKLRLSPVYDLISEDLRVFATKGSTITRRSETEIEVSHPSGAQHVVDPANFDRTHLRFNAIAIARAEATTIVAESDADGVSDYRLIIQTDPDENALRVEQRYGGVGGGIGIHYHWIILVPASKDVFVFGAGSSAAYIHKVSLDDGSLDFSFTTAY